MSKIQISLDELDSITEIDEQAAETISGAASQVSRNCWYCKWIGAKCPSACGNRRWY